MEDKKKNPLDGLFRKKLNEDHPDADQELWNDIEQHLSVKSNKRRRRIIFFFPGAFLMAGLVTLFYFGVNQKPSVEKSDMGEKSEKIVAENQNQSTAQDQKNSFTQEQNAKGPSANGSDGNSSVSPAENQSGESTSSSKQTSGAHSSVTASSKNNIEDHIQTTASTDQQQPNTNSSAEKNESGIPVSNENSSVGNNRPVADQEDTVVAASEIKTDEIKNDAVLNDASSQIQNDTVMKNNVTLSSSQKNDSVIVAKEIPAPDSTVLLPSVPKHLVNWYVEGGVSYGSNSSTLSNNQSSDYYLQRRNTDETSLNTFGYVLHAGMMLHHFQFQSGIDVMSFGETLQYENRANCIDLKDNGGYYDQNNIYHYYYDTTIHVEANEAVTLKNGKQHNTYIGIPLQAGYSISLKSISVQLTAGASGTVPLKWNSFYLNKQVTGLENPDDEKMISPVLFNVNAGAGVAVPLTENFDILFSFQYRRNLNSVFRKTYFVNQKYQSAGAGLSVRYRFGEK